VTAGKYARAEIERRFLLTAVPDGEEVLETVDIEDRYLDGTRLRLRRQVPRGGPIVVKLTQKLAAPGEHGEQGVLTTFYLSEAEHAALASLPAGTLRKTRLIVAPYGVDVFAAPLDGLVLAEIEFDSLDAAAAFRPAPFCLAEVSADRRFTGGSLVRASRDEVAAWAAEHGIELRRPRSHSSPRGRSHTARPGH
jgi:CYTH domain-containing protein